jgi:hypothetical protein
MDTRYVIEGKTLTDIANAIRTQENSSETIPTTEFAKHIEGIEPVVEEYMRITDFLDYPAVSEESNYTQEEIARCTELYNFYSRMEDITNG